MHLGRFLVLARVLRLAMSALPAVQQHLPFAFRSVSIHQIPLHHPQPLPLPSFAVHTSVRVVVVVDTQEDQLRDSDVAVPLTTSITDYKQKCFSLVSPVLAIDYLDTTPKGRPFSYDTAMDSESSCPCSVSHISDPDDKFKTFSMCPNPALAI